MCLRLILNKFICFNYRKFRIKITETKLFSCFQEIPLQCFKTFTISEVLMNSVLKSCHQQARNLETSWKISKKLLSAPIFSSSRLQKNWSIIFDQIWRKCFKTVQTLLYIVNNPTYASLTYGSRLASQKKWLGITKTSRNDDSSTLSSPPSAVHNGGKTFV